MRVQDGLSFFKGVCICRVHLGTGGSSVASCRYGPPPSFTWTESPRHPVREEYVRATRHRNTSKVHGAFQLIPLSSSPGLLAFFPCLNEMPVGRVKRSGCAKVSLSFRAVVVFFILTHSISASLELLLASTVPVPLVAW